MKVFEDNCPKVCRASRHILKVLVSSFLGDVARLLFKGTFVVLLLS